MPAKPGQIRTWRGSQFLNDLYFSDENHGWVVGSTSAMAYTSDGGATWVRLNPPR